MFNVKEYVPSNPLNAYIECIWAMEGISETGEIQQERLVPGGRAEIIFSDSDILWYGNSRQSIPVKYSSPFLLGQRDVVTFIGLAGGFHFLGVRFKPGCHSLFQITPANRYSNKITPLSDIYGTKAYPDIKFKDFSDGIEKVETWLLEKFTQETADWRMTQHIIDTIMAGSTENITILQLSKLCGWNYKKMERAFGRFVGYTPKEFLKLARFKTVLENKPVRASLTQSTYQFGFYDQSHFIREFRHYTGLAPSLFYNNLPAVAKYLFNIKE